MELTIDGREPPAVFAAFLEVKHLRANLEVGDFLIASGSSPVIIIERKSWADLVSSLGDNRLSEQTARIVEKCKGAGARPVLIVECDRVYGWEGKSGGLSNKFIDCVISKYSIEGFSVMRTKDVSHTASLVKWLLDRCIKGKIPGFEPTLEFRGHAGEQKFRKKDYDNPWEIMLTAIRGVSKKKAKDVCLKYKNAKELLSAFVDKKNLDIKGIGKKLESDIKEAFLGKSAL